MIDLHTHTTASDGQYSPSQLVEKAASKGISVLAITDHVTVAGLKEGVEAARRFGITFVPGIEFNIERPNCEFHLLGLGLYDVSKSLIEASDFLAKSRAKRNLEMIEKLNSDGYSVSIEELQSEFPTKSLGRPHIAKWLEKKGIVKNVQQAFDKYLGRGRPWYVERTGINLDVAIQAIYDSGGVPVVAHPLSLYLSWTKLEPVMEDFKSRGVAGMECFHPGARVTECLRLEEMARKLGMIVTAGSDFHGEKIRSDRRPGHTCGDKKIEDRFWFEELKPALEKGQSE